MAELNMKNICQQKSVWCDWLFDFLGLKKLKFFKKSIFSSSVGAASCDGNFWSLPIVMEASALSWERENDQLRSLQVCCRCCCCCCCCCGCCLVTMGKLLMLLFGHSWLSYCSGYCCCCLADGVVVSDPTIVVAAISDHAAIAVQYG